MDAYAYTSVCRKTEFFPPHLCVCVCVLFSFYISISCCHLRFRLSFIHPYNKLNCKNFAHPLKWSIADQVERKKKRSSKNIYTQTHTIYDCHCAANGTVVFVSMVCMQNHDTITMYDVYVVCCCHCRSIGSLYAKKHLLFYIPSMDNL